MRAAGHTFARSVTAIDRRRSIAGSATVGNSIIYAVALQTDQKIGGVCRHHVFEERHGRRQATDSPCHWAQSQFFGSERSKEAGLSNVSTHPCHVVALESLVERFAQSVPRIGILVIGKRRQPRERSTHSPVVRSTGSLAPAALACRTTSVCH